MASNSRAIGLLLRDCVAGEKRSVGRFPTTHDERKCFVLADEVELHQTEYRGDHIRRPGRNCGLYPVGGAVEDHVIPEPTLAELFRRRGESRVVDIEWPIQ